MGIWPLGSDHVVGMIPRDWDQALDAAEVGGSQGARPQGVQFPWSHTWSCWVMTPGEDLVPGSVTPKVWVKEGQRRGFQGVMLSVLSPDSFLVLVPTCSSAYHPTHHLPGVFLLPPVGWLQELGGGESKGGGTWKTPAMSCPHQDPTSKT